MEALHDMGWAVDAIAYAPRRGLVAAADINGIVRLWESTGEELRAYELRDRSYGLAFTPDERFLLLGLSSGGIQLWPVPVSLDDFFEHGALDVLGEEQRNAYDISTRN